MAPTSRLKPSQENKTLKLGDRVKCLVAQDGNREIIGKYGRVISGGQPSIGVEFEKYFPLGHDCSGKGKNGYCWRIFKENLLKVNHIFTEGDRIKLTDYSLFGDYKRHTGEIATIRKIDDVSENDFTIVIVWDNLDTSHIFKPEIIIKIIPKTIEEIIKDEILVKGDRVKLISKDYIDSSDNPIWNGRCGKTIGTITFTNGKRFEVAWDNGYKNNYRKGDLTTRRIQ